MALSEITVIGAVTVLADGTLEVRRDRIIMDDDVEIARQFHRQVFGPDTDPAELPVRVRKAATAFWDAATIAAYRAKKAAREELVEPLTTI